MEARRQQEMEEDLERLGWPEVQLRGRRKRNPAELALAVRLRRETTLTVGWIANRLEMGTRKRAASQLHHWGRPGQDPAAAQPKTMV